MASVKNKYRVCTTRHTECSYDLIHGKAYYDRYVEIANAAARCSVLSPEEFEKTFAQPVENITSHEIEWFLPRGSENSIKLSQLRADDPTAYAVVNNKRSQIKQRLLKACKENPADALFLHPLTVGLDDDELCSSLDGQLLVYAWGMTLKIGRQPEEVVRMSATDHSAYKVSYNASEGGCVSFASILRLKGVILKNEKDIPQVIPDEGYEFIEWQPYDPHDTAVESDLLFTAIFQESPAPPPVDEESIDNAEKNNEADIEETQVPNPEPNNPIYYNINFHSTQGGSLVGTCHYLKRSGEQINTNEVPDPVADEGYRFVGWDRQPNGYTMGNADEVFTAHFESVSTEKTTFWLWRHSFWRALLGWLAGLLLLALLLLLLWCFLFGNCWRGNCCCDCEQIPPVVLVTPPDPPDPTPDPHDTTDTITITNPCNEQVASGGDEGYSGYFDLGQQSGTFQFIYNTENIPDEITIYDGRGTSGKVIWHYSGSTEVPQIAQITFSQRYVTIIVKGQESGTYWEFKVGCPN
ncbi:MAG: InlB B-repeat-containing protein [Bacteroidales bacterium]|nr:InlB B-repeat-containing protein [Bacteroidales bacterium]